MTQDKISALLGRPLSSVETTNFRLYLDVAQNRVSDIFCVDICQTAGTKRFNARQGYKTLNVPIFTEIDSVKLDGKETTKYSIYQGSSMNGEWYNNLVFDTPLNCQIVEIEADWGFDRIPTDVQIIIAQVFGMIGDSLDSELVSSKQVEDFRISFNNKTKTEVFASKYAATIAKYSGCVQGNIQSSDYGRVYYF